MEKIALRAVRNYRLLDLAPAPGMNLFFGENARGKTNLLEAVFFLGSLRSFRGAKAPAMVAWGEEECAVVGVVGGRGTRARKTLKVAVTKAGRRVLLDGKRPEGAAEYLLALKACAFSPEDMFLAREYPSYRRRFIDRSVFHLRPGHMEVAARCREAVRQYNAALKAGDRSVVLTWEEALSPLAAELTLRRRERVEHLAPMATAIFERVFGGEALGFVYKSAATGADRDALTEAYRALFEKKRAESLRRGHSVAGPQTDDLVITVAGRDMRGAASRGQGKLAVLSLALADAESYKAERGSWPVLLLDDALSELDPKRRAALVEYISGMGQVFLTSADPDCTKGCGVPGDARVYRVEAGEGGAEIRS